MLLGVGNRRRSAAILGLDRDASISSTGLRKDGRDRVIHGIKAPVMLLRMALGIKVNGILERVGVYPAIPVARRRSRTQTRNHPVWHKVTIVQATFVQRVQPVVQMQVLWLIVLLLLLEEVQIILTLLAEGNTAD